MPTSMSTLLSLDDTLRTFRRRVVLARALAALRTSVVALAGVVVFGVIALRLFDVHVAPEPLWLLALVIPLAFAAVRALRATPGREAFAAHLDRRGRGMGLLLSSIERDPGTWSDDLGQRLAAARAALPRVEPLGAVLAVAGSVAAVALLALLPQLDPTSGPRTGERAIASALESAREELELVQELELLAEEEAAALEQRLDDLEQKLTEQEAVGWSDVDSLVEAMREASEDAARGHEQVRARSSELATALASRAAEDRDRRELSALAARAQELGMFDGLPDDVRAALEALARRGGASDGQRADAAEGSGIDVANLDAERLRELAEALSDRGKVKLDHARDQLAQGVDADALRSLLDQQGEGTGPLGEPVPAMGDGWDPTPGEDGEGGLPGRGGLGRGRGDATLDHLGATEVDLTGMRAEKLPDGIAPPDRWDFAGIGRAEPEVAPERAGPGAAPAEAGGVGAASARRNLAPRHRDAVRRFFQGGGR